MSESSAPQSGRDRSGLVVGILLLIVAGILWLDAMRLGGAVAYGVGPTMMPKVVAIGLVALGLISIVGAFRGTATTTREPLDWQVIAIIIGGFLALTAIIGLGGGFIPAMVVLFVATSSAFGRRAFAIDAALGLVLAFLTYLLFAKLLTLSLPQGPLERLIG